MNGTPDRTANVLQDILRRENRSLLLYVGDAFPWTTAGNSVAADQLRGLIAAEKEAVAALARYLVRQRIPLQVQSSYPSVFTNINFLALDFLLPRLLEAQRHSVAELERDGRAITEREARSQVDNLLTAKRRHLHELEKLATHPAELTRS